MRTENRVLGVAALGLIIVASSGCFGLAHMREGVIKGVDLPEDLSEVLSRGMTEDEIVAALGDPESRRTRKGEVTLRYKEVYSPGVCRPVLLFIPIGPSPTVKTQLQVILRNQQLSHAWTEVVNDKKRPRKWIVKPTADARS